MNTNTNIWTVIREYEYEYEYGYLSYTKPKINKLLYIKAIKVGKNNAYLCQSMQFMVFGWSCVDLYKY